MIGQSFADDIDSANFFDHIDDFLDFPTDELDDLAFTTNAAAFPPIWSTDSLPSATVAAVHDDVFSGNSDHSVLSAALSVPYEDIVQLEWLSNFVDDSFAGAGNLTVNTSTVSPSNQFQTSSPVSVLESSSSSSSCSGEKQAGVGAGKCGRARSKRPRPPSFIPRPPKKITSPTNSGGNVSSDSENHADSCSAPPTPPAKKPKKIKLTFRRDQNGAFGSQGVRKCLHCEITKTPQWRAGPLGPKTLCNACGVRFKSGRLFPEYRPAASPTFVPCFHSNSHKKVLEMRTKQGENAAEESPELIPNTNSGIVLGFV